MTPNDPSAPPARPPGLWDRYVGPGAGNSDQIAVSSALCAGMLLGSLTLDAGPLALTVLTLLAADLCGGLVAHLCEPASRHAHRPGRGVVHHLLWVSGQGLQFAVFVWLCRDAEALRLAIVLVLLFAGSFAVLAADPPMQRKTGLGVVCVALVIVDATVGLQQQGGWFLPLLLTKVFIAYLPSPPAAAETVPADAPAYTAPGTGGSLPRDAQGE